MSGQPYYVWSRVTTGPRPHEIHVRFRLLPVPDGRCSPHIDDSLPFSPNEFVGRAFKPELCRAVVGNYFEYLTETLDGVRKALGGEMLLPGFEHFERLQLGLQPPRIVRIEDLVYGNRFFFTSNLRAIKKSNAKFIAEFSSDIL